MTQIIARSIVPDLGRLACAYFHTSACCHLTNRAEKVDPVGMSPIVILSLCPERRIDIRCFVFPHRVVQAKIETYHTRCPAAGYMGKPETRPLFHGPHWTRARLDSHLAAPPK